MRQKPVQERVKEGLDLVTQEKGARSRSDFLTGLSIFVEAFF